MIIKEKTLDAIFKVSLFLLAVAIVCQCSYAITAGLLDRPPNMDAVPFNEPAEAECSSDKCVIPANIPNECPNDALNC